MSTRSDFPSRVPCASYRLQLQPGFGFSEAEAMVPYLASLGITECYVSPIWKPRPGSTHGYDVCDPNVLNPELGTTADFDQFTRALRKHGLGLIVDIVPNHMAADEGANPWWRDVLRRGADSPHAPVFDIDWNPLKSELRDKVLLPILATGYGEALDSGQLRAEIVDGETVVTYGDRHIPLRVPGDSDVSALNGTSGQPESFDALHAVLEQQPYRLASWKTAAWEVNYRRFFNIDHLVGVRAEDPRVFAQTHVLLGDLIASGVITGVRVDHPDGLALPAEYFRRLQQLAHGRAPGSSGTPAVPQGLPLYLVIEKVLVPGECLDPDWAVHGTTGYEFLNAVNSLFVARERTSSLARVYTRFVGRVPDFAETVYAAKRQVMESTFPGDIDRLVRGLNRLSERDRASRDITWHALRRALTQIVACLDVYRTYVTAAGCNDVDRQRLIEATAAADARTPSIESHAFTFVRDVLLHASSADPDRLAVALRIQQLTGAVFAKAVEDTAFYRHNTLVSLNEVGGNPARQDAPVHAFHRLNRHRVRQTPLAMSATGTHDTKLGEDARARLNVLTERARAWQLRIGQWARLNRSHRTRTATGWAPDRQDEYRFYQVLVALWPVTTAGPVLTADSSLVDRLVAYAIKAVREANRHTSWIRQNAAYEDALTAFVRGTLTGTRAGPFLASVGEFVAEIAPAGVVNSLAQVLVKIASPGVPDFYQGTELWDFRLVDPDNRGAIDVDLRRRRLDEIDARLRSGDRQALAAELLDAWPNGVLKLFVSAEMLRFRREHQTLLIEGDYVPLIAEPGGVGLDVVAFARLLDGRAAVAVAPRLAGRLAAERRWPTASAWADTSLVLPDHLANTELRDVLTGAVVTADSTARVRLADVLATLPVAMLTTE